MNRIAPANPVSSHPIRPEAGIREQVAKPDPFFGGFDMAANHSPRAEFRADVPAGRIRLETSTGELVPLDRYSGLTTMILLLSETMTVKPGMSHRVKRRAETLGSGVRLVCVLEKRSTEFPDALIDRERNIRQLAGNVDGPLLLSVDQLGHLFDVIADPATIIDWLWNDPRPRSQRATAALSMDDLMT